LLGRFLLGRFLLLRFLLGSLLLGGLLSRRRTGSVPSSEGNEKESEEDFVDGTFRVHAGKISNTFSKVL